MSAEPHKEHAESAGERLLGSLVDRAHLVPPEGLAALVAEEATTIGARDVTLYLQDFEQEILLPLTSQGLPERPPEPIDTSVAGRAFVTNEPVQTSADGGRRLWLPLLDGTDRLGVIGLTLPNVGCRERQLCQRLAGLVSELLVSKGAYGDHFFLTRRRRSMGLSAEILWGLLPPLTFASPRMRIAGVLEPAYEAGGDAFDYAVNGDVAEVAIIDAMGHGLRAAVMASVAVSSYRHCRRQGLGFADTYTLMDDVIARQFGSEVFVTALLARLRLDTGLLSWMNAGHPAPMLVRGRRVVRRLEAPTTLPVGFGGSVPTVAEEELEPGDRVLFFTDGVTEERTATGELFGEHRLAETLLREVTEGREPSETVRRLSHRLLRARRGRTSDDATVLLLEWRGDR